MAENKTKPTELAPIDFVNSVEHPQRKADALFLLDWFKKITGEEPVMWGPSLIGYGKYTYKYASGHGGEFFRTGFSPRKQNMSIYVMCGFDESPDLMQKLGKFKTGKSCLYVNKLADIDLEVLQQLVEDSLVYMKEKYGD
tara:strand:+ start:343 stop:762 length:420 start_codon:yes stop_codon:yes gene_type:complete